MLAGWQAGPAVRSDRNSIEPGPSPRLGAVLPEEGGGWRLIVCPRLERSVLGCIKADILQLKTYLAVYFRDLQARRALVPLEIQVAQLFVPIISQSFGKYSVLVLFTQSLTEIET